MLKKTLGHYIFGHIILFFMLAFFFVIYSEFKDYYPRRARAYLFVAYSLVFVFFNTAPGLAYGCQMIYFELLTLGWFILSLWLGLSLLILGSVCLFAKTLLSASPDCLIPLISKACTLYPKLPF